MNYRATVTMQITVDQAEILLEALQTHLSVVAKTKSEEEMLEFLKDIQTVQQRLISITKPLEFKFMEGDKQ